MTRYVGTGGGAWLDEGAYRYRPSGDDRLLARDVAEGVADRANVARRRRTGYGAPVEAKASWYAGGFLGEVAALHPIGSGPDLDAWEGRGGWYGSSDYGRLEVRTTSRWQLFGFARSAFAKAPGLGGWRVTAKDRGRAIVCVLDRDDDLLVLGWAEADAVPRLAVPLGAIVAVVEPPDLHGLRELAVYAQAVARLEAGA